VEKPFTKKKKRAGVVAQKVTPEFKRQYHKKKKKKKKRERERERFQEQECQGTIDTILEVA
jgi:hypothetical protein